jgi:transcriptional regulator with XRE-family HTH domain
MIRTPPAPVTAAVLRWAREDAGLSLRELGELGKVDEDRAREWEGGDSLPTLGQLRQVADGLRRPVAFFLTPVPPEQHTEQPPDFRARQGDVSRSLRRELRRVSERREAYKALAPEGHAHAWRVWREAPPATPEAARERLGVSVDEIAGARDAAAALRLWLDAVEAQGVLVFQMSRVGVDECRGFAQDDEAVPAIVLNGADAPQARSFTLVHELAHLLQRSGALCLLDEDREVEQRCNRFAAAVLLPRRAAAGRRSGARLPGESGRRGAAPTGPRAREPGHRHGRDPSG